MSGKAPDRSAEELALVDRLDDVMAGYEFWKRHKIAGGELSVLDEMLIRWVDAGPAAGAG